MKRAILALAALALLCLTACGDSTAAWAFESSGRRQVGDVEYYFNKAGNYAFVSGFAWDGETELTLTVPDEIEGAAVFGVGGYMGTGVPVNAGPSNDAYERVIPADAQALDGAYPGGWRVKPVTVTLRIGPKVNRVLLSSDWLVREEDDGSAVCFEPRYYVDCDPENETFTSENGRLYRREDGEEVAVMALYWDDEQEVTS